MKTTGDINLLSKDNMTTRLDKPWTRSFVMKQQVEYAINTTYTYWYLD
jgi:hypothetical protein